MPAPKIKICGITNLDDALVAIEAGTDALGFVFYGSSPRAVTPERAREIIRHLPPLVAKVGVFVNAAEAIVRHTIETSGVDTLQFHGEESPTFCQRFLLPIIKAFRIRDAESLQPLPSYETAAWLLDSFKPGQLGGTGTVFHWRYATQARGLGRPIILAGGLTPDNVAEAVLQVQPYGVDVSSGVEAAPGKKDPAKLRDFIAAASLVRTALESTDTQSRRDIRK
jgi:phosphoribosylanthranilate isomerase